MSERIRNAIADAAPWIALFVIACILDERCTLRVDNHAVEGCRVRAEVRDDGGPPP